MEQLSANPLVSVVLAFLNEERFLGEAVESVVQQQYKNWELILIDDGSGDGSSAIARGFADNYPGKIIYTEHEGHKNIGLSASRNHGISISKGELVAVLDADDIWHAEKLQEQVNLMKQFPEIGLLCEASEYWYSWDDASKEDYIVQAGIIRDKIIQPPKMLEMVYPLSPGSSPCPCSWMIRKTVLDEFGAFEAQFNNKFMLFEDMAFLHKMYLNTPVYVSSKCHNKYRIRKGSLVHTYGRSDYHEVKQFFLAWLKDYTNKLSIKSKTIQFLIWKAMLPYKSPFMSKVINKVENYLKPSKPNN